MISLYLLTSANAVETAQEVMPLFVEDGFMFIIAIIFSIIAIIFSYRINKLDSKLESINKTLVEVSKRPCQLECYGFSVEVKDPTGQKLEEIKNHNKIKKSIKNKQYTSN